MTSREASSDNTGCPNCGGPLSLRPLRRYPVLLQLAFGASFVAFLLLYERIRATPLALWSWSAAQAVMGVQLIRARLQAQKRVYRCVRCTPALR